LLQRPDPRIRYGNEISFFRMTVFHHHRAAACPASGLDILPAVSHQKTATDVDAPIARRLQQETGLGFAAVTSVGIVGVAHPDVVQRQLFPDGRMEGFHRFAVLGSPSYIRLVGHDNE
jgi:hypothetical protein